MSPISNIKDDATTKITKLLAPRKNGGSHLNSGPAQVTIWSAQIGHVTFSQVGFCFHSGHGRVPRKALDFKFTHDCTAVNVPCQGTGSTDASSNNACEENASSLIASAANLLSDNSAE